MDKMVYDKFSVVIPSFNEAKTVGRVVEECLKVKWADEVMVVDDGSTDGTEDKLKQFTADKRFHYLKHKQNKGKGAALKTGFNKAKNEVVLFLDADLENITAQKVKKIVLPVMKDEVDVSRASFLLARGRVTEFAIKPMMRVLFPDTNFEQPITGQVCAKKEFLGTVDLEKRWGVDIGILLDAIQAGQRIIEVDIGKLEHKARTTEEKAEMAQQVLETMIRKAGLIQHKYKLVIFTLDETLIPSRSLNRVFDGLGIGNEVAKVRQKYIEGEMNFRQFAIKVAEMFKGIKMADVEAACADVPLNKYAAEVIRTLRKRRFEVAIISSNFSPIVQAIGKRLGIEITDSVHILQKNGRLTGEISQPSMERWIGEDDDITFERSLDKLLKALKVKRLETIMVANTRKSLSLQKAAGLSIAYQPKDKELREVADKTIAMLPEILAIVE